jgi:hypothetical protein
MRYGIIAMLFLCVLGSTAQAHSRHHHLKNHHRHHYAPAAQGYAAQQTFADQWVVPCCVAVVEIALEPPARGRQRYASAGSVVGHPAGCPRTAFCGCGVADRVFGRPVRDLWLAANWLRFPRTAAAPGMVAVFGRHHVAYIEVVHGDGTATVYDPNSGGHLTRIHVLSIARATIVNPHGA